MQITIMLGVIKLKVYKTVLLRDHKRRPLPPKVSKILGPNFCPRLWGYPQGCPPVQGGTPWDAPPVQGVPPGAPQFRWGIPKGTPPVHGGTLGDPLDLDPDLDLGDPPGP